MSTKQKRIEAYCDWLAKCIGDKSEYDEPENEKLVESEFVKIYNENYRGKEQIGDINGYS